MVKRIFLLAGIGLPAITLAAPPTNFGGFGYQTSAGVTTITDSTGTANVTDICSQAGFSCNNAPITGNGFLQLEITDSSGKSYFQTIIADPSQGGFVSETFTTTGNAGNGGAAIRQSIDSTASTSGMASMDTLLTGSFLGNGEKKADFSQSIWNQGSSYSSSDFQSDFRVAMGNNAQGDMIMDVSIAQRLGDAAGVSGSGFSDSFAFDQQSNETSGTLIGSRLNLDSGIALNSATSTNDATFGYSARRGSFTALDNTSYGNTSGGLAMNDGTHFGWAGGDNIARVLIGQKLTGVGNFASVRFEGDKAGGAFTNSSGIVIKDGSGNPVTTRSLADLATSDATTLFSFDAGTLAPF